MYAGLWMYAWDLRDEGVDQVMGFARDSGLNALYVAGSYHHGWFIHPHNPHTRAFFADGGSVYFHPKRSLFRKTKIKPVVARECKQTDWFAEAGKRLDKYDLKLVSWTVCCHNTRLGLAHPEATIHNAFGDSYPHALCPANDDVRRYLVALCRNLATEYPMHAVQLESPGYMGLRHGHHHERDLSYMGPLETALMGMCFCRNCSRKGKAAGVAVDRLHKAVRDHLEALFAALPRRPGDRPDTLAEFAQQHPEWAEMQAFRELIEDSLLHEIREGLDGTDCELHLLGGYKDSTAGAVDVYSLGAYGQKHDRVRETVAKARQGTPEEKPIHCGIRLGLDDAVDGPGELADIVAAIRQGGGNGVIFYNYSESPMTMLRWIKPALAANR